MLFKPEQLIELSHPLLADKECFPYHPYPAGYTSPKRWYIETLCMMCSHIGTHIEVPFHKDEHGLDCKDWPLEKLIGEAVVINVLGKQPKEPITLEDVKKYEESIHEGDFIFLYTGYDQYFHTDNWQPYPHIAEDALEWMLSFKPKAIGTDASGIELPGIDTQELTGEPNHVACFQNGTAIIESLTNLGAIENCRTTVFVLIPMAEQMDAFPARIIAIKDDCK
jgi:arylformamidase